MTWTLPNLLTMGRIAAAPGIGLIFLAGTGAEAHLAAFVLFVLAALTDFLDGWLARRLNQVTALGKMLDPIADKVMVIIALAVLMAVSGPNPALLLPSLAILMREVLVSGLREFLGDVKLPVTMLAKFKTTAQMVAIGGLLLAGAFPGLSGLGLVSLGVLWLAAALTILTGADYFQKAIPHLSRRM